MLRRSINKARVAKPTQQRAMPTRRANPQTAMLARQGKLGAQRALPTQQTAKLGAQQGMPTRRANPQTAALLNQAKFGAQQRTPAQQQARQIGGGQGINMSATAKPAGGGMKKGGSPVRKFEKGGAVYEVNGQRVTKEQYEEAAKKMDKPKSKAEEELFDFADKARARAAKMPSAPRRKTPEMPSAPRGKILGKEAVDMPTLKKAKGGEAKKPPGLYANIHAKRKRIAAGSGEKMRKVGSKGAPTKAAFIKSAKTAKKG